MAEMISVNSAVVLDGDRRAAEQRELDVDVRDEVRRQFAAIVRLGKITAVHFKFSPLWIEFSTFDRFPSR